MATFPRIHREHEVMLRLADRLAGEATSFGRGERGDLMLMRDMLRYLTEYPERYHHPLEDVALWRLADRGLLDRKTAEALHHEQRALRYRGADLLQLLQAALADVLLPRRLMVAAAEQYAATLQEHVDHEERVLLPVLHAHLGAQDWKQITQAASPGAERGDARRVAQQLRRLLAAIAERSQCGCKTAADRMQAGPFEPHPEMMS